LQNETTLAELWVRYAASELGRKSAEGSKNERSMWIRWILPALGRLRLSDIRYSDIEALHRKIGASTPISANRMVASLRFAFNRAIKWQLTKENPAIQIPFFPEIPRETVIPSELFETVINHLESHPARNGAEAILFILLTGCRRGEATKATWDQFDKGLTVWTKPAKITKKRRIHRVPLSGRITRLLQTRKETSKSQMVFELSPEGVVTTIKRTWAEVRKSANCPTVRVHDLRHTFASVLASEGQTLNTVGSMLGHSQTQTTLRYVHLYDEPLRIAANLVADRFTKPTAVDAAE
jgi:integrase